MLGFSAYAQTPYSQAVTSVGANAFLTGGAPATSSVGTFTFIQVVNKTFPAVQGTLEQGTLGFAGLSSAFIPDVPATGSIEDFTIIAKASTTLPASTATGAAGSATVTHTASINATTLDLQTLSLGTLSVTGKANTTLSNVLGAIAAGTIQPNVDESITGVSATISVGTVKAIVGENLESVSATSSTGELQTSGKANITLDGASATASQGSATLDVTVTVEHELVGVSASHKFNKPTQTAVQKTYSNTDYIQVHVVTIAARNNNKIVYVRRA